MNNSIIKFSLVLSVIIALFGAVLYMFYKEEIKISLPTEIPIGYKPSVYGQVFDIKTNKKLKLIHFFNPECPCSKFNIKHIEYLSKTYKNNIDFIAYSSGDIPEDYPIEVRKDTNGLMAKKLGVYSTPQAVLIDGNGKLLYRGNYNKSRYCSNKNSDFVEIAIKKILNNQNSKATMIESGLPYGCSITK